MTAACGPLGTVHEYGRRKTTEERDERPERRPRSAGRLKPRACPDEGTGASRRPFGTPDLKPMPEHRVMFSVRPGTDPPPPERLQNEQRTGGRERVSTRATFWVRRVSRRRMPDTLALHFRPRGVPRARKQAGSTVWRLLRREGGSKPPRTRRRNGLDSANRPNLASHEPLQDPFRAMWEGRLAESPGAGRPA